MAEFIEAGYAGTDTNRIARRAGFSPQTFYRWFADKTAILIEVLGVWDEVERAIVQSLLSDPEAQPRDLAEACVGNIRPFLTFRHHLRVVLGSQPELRAARAQGRQRLLAQMAQWMPAQSSGQLAVWLIQFETLCEALAAGEFSDLGTSDETALACLADLIQSFRSAVT